MNFKKALTEIVKPGTSYIKTDRQDFDIDTNKLSIEYGPKGALCFQGSEKLGLLRPGIKFFQIFNKMNSSVKQGFKDRLSLAYKQPFDVVLVNDTSLEIKNEAGKVIQTITGNFK